MKLRYLLLFLLTLVFLNVGAQQRSIGENDQRPALFAAVPLKSHIVSEKLARVRALEPGKPFLLEITPGTVLEGSVVEKIQHSSNSTSINIRLTNYSNALFNIFFVTKESGKTEIHGRIVHPKFKDVLVLSKENDRYVLVKKEQRLYVTE
jgi:hypothetical protein